MSKHWLLVNVLCLFVVSSVSYSSYVLSDSGARRALLIGINDYAVLPDLKGSLNDVDTMQEILRSRYGFEQNNIRRLTDMAATRAGIFQALKEIVEISGPNDTIYVHYSGHGSQVKDLSGDESDGLDETICPQDARTEGIADITDDELDSIISGFRTRSVTMVLDSCHSGTGLRGSLSDVRLRSVVPDRRLELYPAGKGKVLTRAIVTLKENEKHLLFTGAASHQSALDGPFAGGRYHGLFTYSLSSVLKTLPLDATAREVMFGVGKHIDKMRSRLGGFPAPEPQLEGSKEYLDRPLFEHIFDLNNEGSIVARLPWIEVIKDASGNLQLLGGDKLGAQAGSIWAIFPDGEAEFLPSEALAVFEVDQLEESNTILRLVSGARMVLLPDRMRAVLVQPAPVIKRLALLLGQVAQPLKGELERKFRHLFGGAVIVVAKGSVADAVLNCDVIVGNEKWRCLLRGVGSGLDTVEISAGTVEMAEKLAKHLWRPVLVASLQSMENASSKMQFGFKVHGRSLGSEQVFGERGIRITANTAVSSLRFYNPGASRTPQNSLQLEFTTNRDCYLTVIDIDSSGDLGQLFPNKFQKPEFYPNGKIIRDKNILIPDSLTSVNRAGFNFDYAPPAGDDTLQAFCMQNLADAELLRNRVAKVKRFSTASDVTNTRSVLSNLRRDLSQFTGRGIIRLGDKKQVNTGSVIAQGGSRSDWTAASLTLEISE